MYATRIRNPKTGLVNSVKAWHIAPRAVMDLLRDDKLSARDIGWMLLGDDQSIQAMRDTQDGDDAGSNFALNAFENALDWGLGIAVVKFIHMFIKERGCLPKPFSVVATRKGDVFCVGASGQVYQVLS